MKLRTFAFAALATSSVTTLALAEEPAASPAPAPAVAVAVAPAPAPAPAPVVEEPRARLDYSDGTFYLRSKNDNLVLFPSGRMHIDTYAFAGKGVSDYQRSNGTGLKANMLFRRFILELGGLVRGKWFFYLGGNFAPNRLDADEAVSSSANVYDGWVGYDAAPEFKVLAGQFNIPVSMENVTSSRWLDLMERSFTARLAAPYNKDLGVMAVGSLAHGMLDYQVAAVGGDGQNRPSVDNRWDVMPRVVFRPMASDKGPLGKLHVGVSGRFGHRDPKAVWYEAPAIQSPGGYGFWSGSYGSGATKVRISPSGSQLAVVGEAYVPFERFDLRGELLYLNEGRREEPNATPGQVLRVGSLKGTTWYAQASFWPFGAPRINGNPGTFGTPKLPKDSGKESPYGVQIVARYEQVRLDYDANSKDGDNGSLDAKFTGIKINAYQLGVNYWATKHVRLTGEYSLYQTPKDQQALAPGARANGNDKEATSFHELSFRVGLAL